LQAGGQRRTGAVAQVRPPRWKFWAGGQRNLSRAARGIFSQKAVFQEQPDITEAGSTQAEVLAASLEVKVLADDGNNGGELKIAPETPTEGNASRVLKCRADARMELARLACPHLLAVRKDGVVGNYGPAREESCAIFRTRPLGAGERWYRTDSHTQY
jgi:hypothetical protein